MSRQFEIVDDLMGHYSIDNFSEQWRPDWAPDGVPAWLLVPRGGFDQEKSDEICRHIVYMIHKFCLEHNVEIIDNHEQPAFNRHELKIMIPLMKTSTPFLASVLLHEFAHATGIVSDRPNNMGRYGNGLYCPVYANEEVVAETAPLKMMELLGYDDLDEDFLWRPAGYIWSFKNYYRRIIHQFTEMMEQEKKNLPGPPGVMAELMWLDEGLEYRNRWERQRLDHKNIPGRVEEACSIMMQYA